MLAVSCVLWAITSVDRSPIDTETPVGWPTQNRSQHSKKKEKKMQWSIWNHYAHLGRRVPLEDLRFLRTLPPGAFLWDSGVS